MVSEAKYAFMFRTICNEHIKIKHKISNFSFRIDPMSEVCG